MDINEEDKEDYSLLDDKRKEQIIFELQEEIRKQKDIYLNKDQNIINDNTEEIIERESNEVINSKNLLTLNNDELDKENSEFSKKSPKINNNNNIFSYNNETNIIFEEINNFILKNNQKEENSVMPINKNDELKINEVEELPLSQPKMENLVKTGINNKNTEYFCDENIKSNNLIHNVNYLNHINNKKNILYSNINKYLINQEKNNIKKNNSFNIKPKIEKDNSNKIIKPIKTSHAKEINANNIKNKKIIKKSKSTNKIRNNYSNKKIKNKSVPHTISSNEKSKEKYNKIKLEINNKFKKEHPFKPNIISKYNKNVNKTNINETEEERYYRLSRPKTYEIKGKHLLKAEEDKLNNKNNKININKINPKEVSNRLYKLHQQIKNKKEQVQKIFEEKQLNKCSFAPEINNYSKKIMNKINNKVPFNERNDNYIKQQKENMNKLREEIDKKIKEKSIPKMNEMSKIILMNKNNNNSFSDNFQIENNVYNRLYENKYYSNDINIELDKNDFTNIKQNNNINEINNFLERQKIFENIKQEHIYKNKIINNINNISKNEELTFKPKINSASDIIVRTNPERIGEDIDDKFKRLYDEAAKIKQKKEQLKSFYEAQYNFTPKINELSKIIGNTISSNKKNLSDYKINNSFSSKENLIKKEIDNNCTFKPEIVNNHKYKNIQSNYKYDDNISQKIQEELINKNKKMNILKSEQLYNYVKECKFIPETNKNLSNLNLNNIKDDIFYQRGLKKYMEQMGKAKQAKIEKEEREKKVFLTGENWKKNNTSLVPKPFNLSKNNNQNKIEKIREEIKNEEMKECSFKPITNESQNKNIVRKLLKQK